MNYLRISGEKINIEKPLILGNCYDVMGEIEIREDANLETDEQEKDRLFKGRWTTNIDILNDKGVAIKGKNSSLAKSMRGAIYHLQNSEDCKEVELDQEDFYQLIGNKIIRYLPEIYQFIKNKS